MRFSFQQKIDIVAQQINPAMDRNIEDFGYSVSGSLILRLNQQLQNLNEYDPMSFNLARKLSSINITNINKPRSLQMKDKKLTCLKRKLSPNKEIQYFSSMIRLNYV